MTSLDAKRGAVHDSGVALGAAEALQCGCLSQDPDASTSFRSLKTPPDNPRLLPRAVPRPVAMPRRGLSDAGTERVHVESPLAVDEQFFRADAAAPAFEHSYL